MDMKILLRYLGKLKEKNQMFAFEIPLLGLCFIKKCSWKKKKNQ